jgi:small nuclear ribonucleoprotein (snRNP)-like protein
MSISYNIGAKYEIIGRVPNGKSISAYILKDKTTGKNVSMEKTIVEQLALNRQIYNCSAQVYGEIVNLKGINCKLSQLPKYDRYCNMIIDKVQEEKEDIADLKLVGKVQNGRVITDYVVVTIKEPDNLMKLPRDTVIRLAQDGRIVNARSQMNGSEILLRGVQGLNLSKLQSYKA